MLNKGDDYEKLNGAWKKVEGSLKSIGQWVSDKVTH